MACEWLVVSHSHIIPYYRAPGKSVYFLLSRTQAGPGRTVKQEQEEIFRNHIQTFISPSVHMCWIPQQKSDGNPMPSTDWQKRSTSADQLCESALLGWFPYFWKPCWTQFLQFEQEKRMFPVGMNGLKVRWSIGLLHILRPITIWHRNTKEEMQKFMQSGNLQTKAAETD